MTQPIMITDKHIAVPLTKLGDIFKNVRVLPADDKWEVPYLKYAYRSIYHSGNLKRDIYCGDEIPIDQPGTWQLLFTTDKVTEEQASKVVERRANAWRDYEREFLLIPMSVFTAIKSLQSLLRSKNLNPNNIYAILEKQ